MSFPWSTPQILASRQQRGYKFIGTVKKLVFMCFAAFIFGTLINKYKNTGYFVCSTKTFKQISVKTCDCQCFFWMNCGVDFPYFLSESASYFYLGHYVHCVSPVLEYGKHLYLIGVFRYFQCLFHSPRSRNCKMFIL